MVIPIWKCRVIARITGWTKFASSSPAFANAHSAAMRLQFVGGRWPVQNCAAVSFYDLDRFILSAEPAGSAEIVWGIRRQHAMHRENRIRRQRPLASAREFAQELGQAQESGQALNRAQNDACHECAQTLRTCAQKCVPLMNFDGCPERFLDGYSEAFQNTFPSRYPETFFQNFFSRSFFPEHFTALRRKFHDPWFSDGLDQSNLALVCVIEPRASVPKLSMVNPDFPRIQSTFTLGVVLHSEYFHV